MYKKRNAVILSTALMLSTVAACGTATALGLNGQQAQESFSEMDVSGVVGIQITDIKKVVTATTSTLTITYSLAPTDASGYSFNYLLYWDTEDSDLYESGFSSSQTVDPYVTYSVNETQQKITFTCLKAFGRQLIFTMTCQENSDVYAQVRIDYVRKLLSNGSAKIDNPQYIDGKTVKIDKIAPVYSIGSKGGTPIYDYAASTAYNGSGDYTWAKLISTSETPNLSGWYQTDTVKYQGASIKTNTLISTIRTNVLNYMKSIPTMTNDVIFSVSTLKGLCTFKKEVGFSGNWANDSTYFSNFVKNYKTAYQNGHGLTTTVTYNGSSVYSMRLNLGFNSANLSQISFDDYNLEF